VAPHETAVTGGCACRLQDVEAGGRDATLIWVGIGLAMCGFRRRGSWRGRRPS